MVDEMINTVRAALAPGADAATKEKAASILRAALGMLESGAGGAQVDGPTATAPSAVAPAPDLLTMIVESVRPHLPPEALAEMTRFRVPLIDLTRGNR